MRKKYKQIAGCLLLMIIALGVIDFYKPQSIYEIYQFEGYIEIEQIVYHQNFADSGTKLAINDEQKKEVVDILQHASFRKTFWKYHEGEPKRFDIYFTVIHSDGSYIYSGNIIYAYPNGKIYNINDHFKAILDKGNREGSLYQQLEAILLDKV